jgi:hypothetical protein
MKKILRQITQLCLFLGVCTSAYATDTWHEFYAQTGSCHVQFPVQPQHMGEKLIGKDGSESLRYDAYIAPGKNQAVYLLLVAKYPFAVSGDEALHSLESFLNGLLTNHPTSQLVSADLKLVKGREVLDFFLRNGALCFKGRVFMVDSMLYLLAVEGDIQTLDEAELALFLDSFKMKQ